MAKQGRSKAFETPEELEEYFELYKQHVRAEPIEVIDYVGKDAKEVIRKHYKPLTWAGFEAFLYRDHKIIKNLEYYRSNLEGRYSAFRGVVRAIDREMYENKFAGAAVGIYQHNLIARELGLAEVNKNHNYERPILEGGRPLPGDYDGVSDADLLGNE